MLHIPWQHSCHGMCKILWWLLCCNLCHSKMRISLNFLHYWINLSETGSWAIVVTWILNKYAGLLKLMQVSANSQVFFLCEVLWFPQYRQPAVVYGRFPPVFMKPCQTFQWKQPKWLWSIPSNLSRILSTASLITVSVSQGTTITRDNFVYASSQWEMALQCNAISYWLGAYRMIPA